MMAALFAVVAFASGSAAWLAWSGRWTRWARTPFMFTFPLHTSAGVALVATFGVVAELTDGDLPLAAAGLVLFPGLALMVIGIVGMLVELPKWTTPRWYRAVDRSDPDLGDTLTAVIVASSTPRPARSPAFAGHHEDIRWFVKWVYDPSPDALRPHGLSAGFGSVGGRLSGHPEGLAFRANDTEARLVEPELAALEIDRHELVAVYTVPAAAGADGEVPARSLLRRMQSPELWRRLVIIAETDVYLFVTHHARRRADEIATYFEIERRPDA